MTANHTRTHTHTHIDVDAPYTYILAHVCTSVLATGGILGRTELGP